MRYEERSRTLVATRAMASSIESSMPSVLAAMRVVSQVRAQQLDGAIASGDVSDPTGQAVAGVLSGRAAESLHRMDARLEEALALLALVANEARSWVDDPLEEVKPVEVVWCTSCARKHPEHKTKKWKYQGTAVPAAERYLKRKLCRFCGEFVADHEGKLPPFTVMDAHHRAQNVTVQLIEAGFRIEAEEAEERRAQVRAAKAAARAKHGAA